MTESDGPGQIASVPLGLDMSVDVRVRTRERKWETASMGISVVLAMTLRMEEGSEEPSPFTLGGRSEGGVFLPLLRTSLLSISVLFLSCSLSAFSPSQAWVFTPVGALLRPLVFTVW